jgi:hypothetical protein
MRWTKTKNEEARRSARKYSNNCVLEMTRFRRITRSLASPKPQPVIQVNMKIRQEVRAKTLGLRLKPSSKIEKIESSRSAELGMRWVRISKAAI